MLDVVVARIGILFEQLMRHQDETRRAEAALERAAIDEGLLHLGQRAIGIEMFDGRDLLAVDPDAEIEAAGHGDVVDQHGAAAAQALAAAFARAEQIEALQQFDEIAMRLDGGRDRFAVEREIDACMLIIRPSFVGQRPAFLGAQGAQHRFGRDRQIPVMRTPTASWMALAIAGETPNVPDSPSPLAPNGPVFCSAVDQFVVHRRDIANAGDLVVGERGIGDLAAVELHVFGQREAELHDRARRSAASGDARD